jgi:hypothetical protein
MRTITFTSEIAGTFSILQIPSQRRTAGIIATAAFFAPLTSISPFSGFPPFTMIFSTERTPILKDYKLLLLLSPQISVIIKQSEEK